MLDHLGRYWRVVATAISFTVFGMCGLVLGLIVFPLLNLFVRAPARRIGLARDVLRLTMRAFVGLMRVLGVLRYDIVGLDKLDRGGLLILANHPTLIDTVFLMAFVKRPNCIVKSTLWHNPFMRGALRAAGYISNQGGVQLIADCIDSLRAGNNLIVFPEGTRTPACGAITLKRGAANIAIRGRRAVTPVLIDCQPRSLGRGDKWWRVPVRHMQFTIEIRDDIDVARFTGDGVPNPIAVRQLTEHLQRFFTEENRTNA
ncbi:MAG: lysophospholipid acyltransferase family protein [Telluria sp.]